MVSTTGQGTVRGSPGARSGPQAEPREGPAGSPVSSPEGLSGESLEAPASAGGTSPGRLALRAGLLILSLGPALVLGLPIVLLNALQFRSLRRVLFLQERVGKDGRVFRIVKFRTMREVHEPRAPRNGHYESWQRGLDGLRVTAFGRFLRNTHLDELPQLLNILRGEMDFVGPRPEMVEIDAWACRHVPGFRRRNALLPGVTGLAQITQGYAGRDVGQYQRKLALDRDYIERRSVGLDLEILLRTALWMLRGRGWRPRVQHPVPQEPPGL